MLDESMGMSFPTLDEVAERAGVELVAVGRAAIALDSAGLITLRRVMSGGDPAPWFVTEVSAQARRWVGQWPSAERIVDTLVRRLSEEADSEPEEQRRSRLREAATTAGGAARGVLVEVLSSVIAKQLGA